jgi:hypothetical protein
MSLIFIGMILINFSHILHSWLKKTICFILSFIESVI